MSKEDSSEGTGDALLNRYMTGDWDAVGQMGEQVDEDRKIVLEIVDRMKEVRKKTLLGRTNEELMQDREAVELAKRQIRALGARTHTRNKLRKAGMALQLFKTRCESRELKRESRGAKRFGKTRRRDRRK